MRFYTSLDKAQTQAHKSLYGKLYHSRYSFTAYESKNIFAVL